METYNKLKKKHIKLPDAHAGTAKSPYRTPQAHRFAPQFSYQEKPKTWRFVHTPSTVWRSSVKGAIKGERKKNHL